MLIAAARVLTAEEGADPVPRLGFVEVTEAVIGRVGGGAPAAPADVTLTDGYLVPGFVDLQVNGHFGVEFQTADAASWADVARRLPSTGTTAFVPTLITAPVDSLVAALTTASAFAGDLPASGAQVLGVHLEGPFISPRVAVRIIRPGSPTRPRRRSPRLSRLAAACSGCLRWHQSGRARWRRSTSW